MVLLLSLFSPIAELFPNLYMSWWLPDNGKIQAYLKAWKRRVFVVLVVWLPILFTLGLVTSTILQLLISMLVFTAFGLRLYFFDKSLEKAENIEIDFIEPSTIPEILYFIAFSSIGWVLYGAVANYQWLVPLGIGFIFFGAFMMGRFRRGDKKNLTFDFLGRGIFTVGFLLNLYNLARAASIIIVE